MKKRIFTTMMAMILCLTCFTGCGKSAATDSGMELVLGGVLVLSVNPEIAVEYDEKGIVTAVSARNDDALNIISSCKNLIGKETHDVVTKLVTAIGEAGYFVEEVEGERRQITIEIEAGSKLPHDTFLDEVIQEVQNCVNENDWKVPMDIENESEYGATDYNDTDYGSNNDGVTDYNNTDYGPNNNVVTDHNNGVIVYEETDYGVSDYDDGVTVYEETDYGVSDYDDGVTVYEETDYGVSDYDDGVTVYEETDYGVSDYDDGVSAYEVSDYGVSDYDDGVSAYEVSDYGVSDYDDGVSDYEETDYGNSDYDESDYGNSDYDD